MLIGSEQWRNYPYNAHSSACSKTSRRFVRICLLTHPSIRMILREASYSRIYTFDGLDCPVFQQHTDMYSLLQGETEKPRKLDIWFAAPGKKGRAQEWELFVRESKSRGKLRSDKKIKACFFWCTLWRTLSYCATVPNLSDLN